MPAQTGKLFYKIGEVSRLAQVEPYILRYWENEFPVLSPRKSSGGQRVYQQKDLDLVLSIKRMLHEEGYTIAGARKKIAEDNKLRGAKREEPVKEPHKDKNDSPQMPLPFFGAEDGIQDALVKFKAEIKELINLVK